MDLESALAKQRDYIIACGGILGIHEADDVYNDMNREQIQAILEQHGRVFLGKINYSKSAEEPIYTEFVGQEVCTGACDFCVPVEDQLLADLICRWRTNSDSIVLNPINKRIDQIGGILTLWF